MFRPKLRWMLAGAALVGACATAQETVEPKDKVPAYVLEDRDNLSMSERFKRLWFNLNRLPETLSADIPELPAAFEREFQLQVQESYDRVDGRVLILQSEIWNRTQPGYHPRDDLFLRQDEEDAENLVKDWAEDALPGMRVDLETGDLIRDIGSLFKWEIEMFGEEGKPEVNPDKLPPTLAEKAREDALADETATRYSREDGEFGKTYSIKGGIKFKPRTDGFEAVVYGRLRSFNMLKVEWDELTVEQTQENSDTFLCMSLEEALSEQWYLRANSRIPLNGDRTCFGGVSLSRENKGKSAFSMRVTGGRFPEDSDNSDEHDAYQTEVRFHISYTRLF